MNLVLGFVLRDSRARPPYTVAADKSTRNEFRRFMEKNLDAYDYNKARVSWKRNYRVEGIRDLIRSFLLPCSFIIPLGNLPGARAIESRNGSPAGYKEKGAKGSSQATGAAAAEAEGAGRKGARGATAVCCAQ